MGKVNSLEMVIADLKSAAVAINDCADTFAEMFNESVESEPKAQEPAITLEEVRAVLANKSRIGFTADVRALLQKYGAEKLSGVNPADYKALLEDAEVLGSGS